MAANDTTMKWFAGLNVLLGVWLLLTPFFLGMALEGTWNAIIVGVLITFLSVMTFTVDPADKATRTGASMATLMLGLWVIVSPFVFAVTSTALWTHLIIGILVAVVATVAAFQAHQTPSRA